MATSVEFELLLLNENPSESHMIRRNSGEARHIPDAFKAGLRKELLGAFKDMAELHIRRITGTGRVISKKSVCTLSDVIAVDDETMGIETEMGYRTFSSYRRKDIERIDHAMMLLVWKWSPHFTPDESRLSHHRACLICGKVQWGKPTGMRTGGIRFTSKYPGLLNEPSGEVYIYPHDHCFNPECFSHQIEKMIDPAYIYVPPKPGEDAESALMESIRKDPSMREYMRNGEKAAKDRYLDDPAVKRFLKDMS